MEVVYLDVNGLRDNNDKVLASRIRRPSLIECYETNEGQAFKDANS